jgi:tricorn protease
MNGVTSAGYLRYPHVHGELVVFVAEDDIWLAPAEGGRAWRLSADAAQVSHPRFSRDGTSIAWTSWRDGNAEVYVTDPEGSAADRLTYWGDNTTRVAGWTSRGEVLAITAAGQPETQFSWAYAVPVLGAPPTRLPFGPVSDLALEETGTALLTGRMVREPAYWKRYRGGTAGKLWIAGPQDPLFTRVLAGLEGQLASPMLIGGRLFFVSDHEGTGNIYSCAPDGTGLVRHTDHDGCYARNPATDGQRIVYHVAGDIWLLDGPDAPAPRKLEVTLGSPAAARAPRLISAKDHLGSLDCDQTGQASVVEVRGTVHWLTHQDGPARALSVGPDARARLPRVLGEEGRVVWITDASGADALEIASVTGEPRSVRIAEGLIGDAISLAPSPDGVTVAVAAHDGRLLAVDAASGRVTELATSDDGVIDGLSWSPDSAWLAWSQPGPQPLSRIRLARIADHEIIDVTDGRFADTDPVFTADGLYLAFLSRRSFDPVYDAQSFDMSFPFGSRPYLVPLAAETPSPFGPLPGGRPVGQDPAASGENPDSAERSAVTLDVEGLPDRVVGVPVPEARYSGLRTVKGGLAWLREPIAGVLGESAADLDHDAPRPALERFDLRKREVTELADELDWFEVSGDGTRLVVKDRDDVRVLPSERKEEDHASGEVVTVDLSRARFQADPAALWRYAYAEAGRLMRRDYWVPDMSGVDWDGVLDAYRPLLDRIRGADDFADLLWEVVAELGTSHAYVVKAGQTSVRPGPGPEAVGQLGADISRDDSGRWVVDRVLPGESSDPRARSPLAAPGVAVRPGDELVAVDGQPVDPARGPWPLLAGTAGKPVELTVLSSGGRPPQTPPDRGDPSPQTPLGGDSIPPAEPCLRRVVVVPLRDERRLRYQDWVAGRRRLVRELGEGRLGYLHIPDMVGEGWSHFHRDLRTEMRFDALVMDVRGNSGGHISELVVEKLARRVIAWDVPRWRQPVSYPQEARRGSMVTVADEFAGSDGDIVTAAIRLLGLGPVVGTRTWGGVVGYTELHTLVDGTQLTIPQLAFWFEEYGWDVENYGVDPDVEVLNTPDDWAAGRDPQLETAVRLALEALEKQGPAVRPDTATGPVKARPPLPPRAPAAAAPVPGLTLVTSPDRVAATRVTSPDRVAATRASYDAVAVAYADAMSDELRHKPLDRALLTAFGEQVRRSGASPEAGSRVWDVGCGPGHVTAFLAGLGLDAAGIDLSAAMVAQARARHPDLQFSSGSMTALPARDGSWAGLVSFYSLIHMIDDADVRTALAEFRRVLADGGLLLLAVHDGQEVRHSGEWFGARVDVSFRFFEPGWLAAELERAGFAVEAVTRRQPYPGAEVATERAYLLARARLRAE